MGFFGELFNRAAEVDLLRQQLAFSEKERDKLQWKVDSLEAEVKSERKRFDKTQAAVMDFTMQKSGIAPKVAKAQENLFEKADIEQKFSLAEDATITALAKNMMQADEESGVKPYSIEKYIEAIKADPSKYNAILVN